MLARSQRLNFVVLIAFVLVASLTLNGCAKKTAWMDSGTSYTAAQARALLDTPDIESLASKSSSEAARLRLDALVSLRDQGDRAASAADLITRTFPADTIGVPTYVELAKVGGREALVIVEAWGIPKEKLSHKRLWVVDAKSGDVLDSVAK